MKKRSNRRRLHYYEVYDDEGALLTEGIAKEINEFFGFKSISYVKVKYDVLHVGYSYLIYKVYNKEELIVKGDNEKVKEYMGWEDDNTVNFYVNYKKPTKKGIKVVVDKEREVRYFD